MFSRQQRECQQLPHETMHACLFTFFAAIDPVLFSGKFIDDSSLEFGNAYYHLYNHAHTDTHITAPDLHINEEMVPDFWHKFIGASCLHQKLANLKSKSEALGFGRNNQHGAATSKSRNDTSVGQNVHISIRQVGLSASWTVGELVCWRVVRLPSRGISTFRSPVFSFLGSKVPSGNLRSQEQKFPGTFAPGNRHSWPRTTKFSMVNCGKRLDTWARATKFGMVNCGKMLDTPGLEQQNSAR